MTSRLSAWTTELEIQWIDDLGNNPLSPVYGLPRKELLMGYLEGLKKRQDMCGMRRDTLEVYAALALAAEG